MFRPMYSFRLLQMFLEENRNLIEITVLHVEVLHFDQKVPEINRKHLKKA